MRPVRLVTDSTQPEEELQARVAKLPLPESQWPEPLTLEEWDKRFPGIMDNLGLLGGAANVVLQLAYLPVGHGVIESRVDSGNLLKNPKKRSITTLTYLAVAMLGTTEEKLAYRQAVNRSHAHVHNHEKSTIKYNAFDPELQLWVAACLFYGYWDTNQKLFGAMSPEKSQELYSLCAPLATTLQVRADMWPKDFAAWQAYWNENVVKLEMDDKVRSYLNDFIDMKYVPTLERLLMARLGRFLTTGFLPEHLREQLQLPWGPVRQATFTHGLRTVGRVSRLLPRSMRQSTFRGMIENFRSRRAANKPLT